MVGFLGCKHTMLAHGEVLIHQMSSAHVVQKKEELFVTAVLGMSLAPESLVSTHVHKYANRAGGLWLFLLRAVEDTHWGICSLTTAAARSLLVCPGGRITMGIRAPMEIAAMFRSPTPWTKDKLNSREW